MAAPLFTSQSNSFLNKQAAAPAPKQSSGGGVGGAVGRLLGFDITPGFNINSGPGGGVPFVSATGGTGKPPAPAPAPVKSGGKTATAGSAAAPAGSSGGAYSGSGYTGSAAAPAVDAFGLTAQQRAAKQNNYGVTQGGYAAGARTQLGDVGNTYNDKTMALLAALESGEHEINEGSVSNALNLRRSMQNIVKGIQTGVRSGGVTLAGMNASDSGASEALARAWAKAGNTQGGEARGQAATVDQDLQYKQGQLNRQRDEGVSGLDTFRNTETNRVRGDFGQKLQSLQADASANGIEGVVQTSLVDQILNEALGRLSGIDQQRGQRLGGIRQLSPEEVLAQAAQRDAEGQAADMFDVSDTGMSVGGPGGAPVNGAPLGQLPIFVKRKDTVA